MHVTSASSSLPKHPAHRAPAETGAQDTEQHTLHIAQAGSGWGLVMQSGAGIACTVGVSLRSVLHEGLGLAPEQTAKIDVMLLDGKPVDNPSGALVPDGARIALAAGLPGIAGLAMKSGSAVRGLRPGITCADTAGEIPPPAPGRVELALFSLALPLLARHFLQRGIEIPAGRLSRYVRPAVQGHCLFDGQHLDMAGLARALALLAPECPVRLSAEFTV